MQWVWSNLPMIWDLLVAHVVISAIPIVVSFLISIPLGYLASRRPALRAVLLVAGNIFYTIPSIALLVLVPVLLGLPLLTPNNLVIALSIYGLALMIRVSADAFAAVPADVVESARAQGFSRWQRFLQVELPLAGPVLLAGTRVVSVSTVSLVTVGALIGINQLGNLFIEGFQRSFFTELFTGMVAVLVVALVFDAALILIGRIALPWNRRGAAGPTGRRRRRQAAVVDADTGVRAVTQ